MKFLENHWFPLIISFTVAFVISIRQSPPEFTTEGLLYFGLELFILMTLGFIVFKTISFLFSKIERKLSTS